MPAVEDTPCPNCGEKTLTLHQVLQAKLAGTYSLAGAQPKVAAVEQTKWRCGNCAQEGPALIAPQRTRRRAK